MGKRLWTAALAFALIAAGCGDGDVADPTDPTTGTTEVVETTAVPTTVATPLPVSVDTEGGGARTGSQLLLADDFQDGDAEGWQIDSGWYVLGAGSQYRLASSGSAWVWWPGGEEWEPSYVLRSSVRVDAGGIAVSLAVGAEGRYVVHLHEDGTDLLLDRPWGDFETLASAEPVAIAAWHQVTAGVDGGEIQVYVDGVPLLGATVEDSLTAGSVGFGALSGSVVSFDNVFVTVLENGLPAFQGPEPAPELEPVAVAPVVEEPPGEEPQEGPGEDPGEEPQGGGGSDVDLVVTNVVFSDPITAAGEEIPITIWVVNEGTEVAGALEVAWEAMGSVCIGTRDEILPGDRAYISCTAPGLPAGLHQWTVHADHDDRIVETDKSNNVLTGIIEVAITAPTVPDLLVATATSAQPVEGVPLDFEAGIRDGNQADWEGAFHVLFTLDGLEVCRVRLVWPDGEALCTLPGMIAGSHVLEIQVDPFGDVDENREDNNRLMKEYQIGAG